MARFLEGGWIAGAFVAAIMAACPLPVAAQGAPANIADPGPLKEQSFGRSDAPVTVIEYASLTCHHCRDFHTKTWPEIKARYVDTGKVRFIMREFPLDALAAGGFMLARCSGDDKWYAVVDLLFRADDKWAHAADPVEGLRSIMRQTGMGNDAFESCLKDQKLLDQIKGVADRGTAAGVDSTPTFFINGRKESGALTLEQFSKLVEPLLARQ